MAPRAQVSVESAVNALKKHIKYFIPPEKPKWSSKIWRIISDELGNQWNENAVRTNVNQNRRNILSIALQECGYFRGEINTESSKYDDLQDENVDSSSSDEDDDSNDPDYCDQAAYFNNIEEIQEFDVEISKELWNSVVKPSAGNSQPKLNKGAWTSIIAYAFWEQYRLKCCFIFDKGYINVNVKAHCKSKKCGNRLFGFIEGVPFDEGPVYIKIKCCDTRFIEKHEDFQRPLRGETRKAVSQQVRNLGVHAYNRRAAIKLLRSGDTACPFLYKPNVLHQAKKQFLDNERGIKPIDRKDIFPAIDRINENPLYRNSILLVGKPFFVFYATQSQMHCYKEYRRLNKKSSICIDATGGLVRKIISEGKKSSYIFLYQIVINFNKTSQCVYQMLTEMQDAHTITMWLNKWVSAVKLLPHEAVSDGSRAQLNAMSRAFNDMSLKQYIKLCFESIKNPQKLTDIKTYIRLDVAHFVHTITGWSCFKSAVHPSVKKFYIYCICLLIDCKEFSKFERILMLILIISNTAHEDSVVYVKDEKFTPLTARTELENLIMSRKVEEFFLNVSEQIEKMEVDPEKNKFRDTELENSEKDSVSISCWIKNLLKVSKNVFYQGNNLQSFFLPALENPLVEAVVEFPLWTNICIPHSDVLGTSSYIEEDFKDLKEAMRRQVSLPTDVYTFLKLHLDYLIGGVSLFRMKITKFIDEHINNTEKSLPDLLNCNLSEINVEEDDSSKNLMKEEEKNKYKSSDSELMDTTNTSLSKIIVKEDDSFKNSMKGEEKKNNSSDSEPIDTTNTSNQFDQGVSITSDINKQIKFDLNTDNSVNVNYNLSDIIEKKNKNDPFENWRGKGKNNKLNPFDWMSSGESADGNEAKPEIRTNFIPKDVGKFSNITHVNDDINLNNANSKIKLANNYPKDHDSNIKTYQVDDDSRGITKTKALKDHDYGFTTSTPLEDKKPKKTLAAAIDKISRQNINSGKYFNDCPEMKLQNKFVEARKESVTSEEK
ncbi:Similar to NOF: 120.7 kDa protein in NOF-FB transposable element (Drosophila melanogaster) [Cotesia congregata]|uniref:Similar to NOF: 120.7 kDa protein in NOF-FB transposable element (Drosophila melanogaster) n=1 Tax=Cotesia congregata TaxID=51543 RepID=A0A8J2MH16_COTCN|nr:Similar to NOF: 120.7 kDa protein in NOF-FB transposable element (Drosophila melanogaster) [Cotesia congregata]